MTWTATDLVRFFRDVLVRMRGISGTAYPVTCANLIAFLAWHQGEDNDHNPDGNAAWNPLNTTLVMAGSTLLPGNTAGVQEYASHADGIEATARTLLDRKRSYRYGPIRRALRDGSDPYAVLKAVEASAWGTGGLASQVLASWQVPGG